MNNNENLTFERLVDWVEGRLPDAEAAAVARQVQTADAEVQAQVAWLRAFSTLQKQLVLATPPATVRATLTEQFAAYARAQRTPTLWQRLTATLTFDSNQQAAATAGVRGAEAMARQWLYSTPILDIVLNLQPHLVEGRVDLLGQLLPKAEGVNLARYVVEVWLADEFIIAAAVDDLGEFAIGAVEPAHYRLLIRGDDLQIELTSLDLTQPFTP
jgi:hypothetical protein